jgi:hypothetical protein
MATYGGGYKLIGNIQQQTSGSANSYSNGAGYLGTVATGHIWVGTLFVNTGGAAQRNLTWNDGTNTYAASFYVAASSSVQIPITLGPGERVGIQGANASDFIMFVGAEFSA